MMRVAKTLIASPILSGQRRRCRLNIKPMPENLTMLPWPGEACPLRVVRLRLPTCHGVDWAFYPSRRLIPGGLPTHCLFLTLGISSYIYTGKKRNVGLCSQGASPGYLEIFSCLRKCPRKPILATSASTTLGSNCTADRSELGSAESPCTCFEL